MSLISDALKKARQEAARQDSYRQGVPYAVGAADARPARAPWISLLAGLGAGCILAAAIFAMAFFAGWGPFHKPVTETQVAAAPAAPAALGPQPVTAPPVQPGEPAVVEPPSLAKPVAVETPAPKPAPEPPKLEVVKPAPQVTAPPPAPPRPAPETPPATATPAPQPTVEAPAPAPVQAAASAPAAPAQSVPASGLAEGGSYTGELPVPGGGAVKLNGIVYSPDHPIAVLDGRVMGPGETVQGFTVVAIESSRVKLQGHGMTVYLSPK